MSYEEPRHPINFVSQRTGLSPHVIRVWERRYTAIQPHRSDTNRRLYSDADVDRLKLLKLVKERGQAIRLIAALSNEELRQILTRVDGERLAAERSNYEADHTDVLESLTGRIRETAYRLDAVALDQVLMDASVQLPLVVLLDGLIGPFMNWVGDRWHEGSIRVAHEHLATAGVRSFLGRIKRTRRPDAGAPCVVLATPSGQDHEIGALMAAAMVASEGWRDVYLGPNLPAQEIALAAMEAKAQVVAVSIVAPGNNPAVIHEFQLLRDLLEERIPLLVGGGGVINNRVRYELDGVYCTESIAEFRDRLAALNTGVV